MLVTGVSHVQQSATAAACSGNLRQIGSGLLAFAGDNNGFFPIAGGVILHGASNGPTGLPGWTEQLEPYLGTDTRIYRCPGSYNKVVSNRVYSYFMGARAAYLDASSNFTALKLQKLHEASKYILGGDITSDLFQVDDADKDDYTRNPAFGTDVIPFHNGRANILFADGSVRSYKSFDTNDMEISYSGTGTY